MHWKKTSYLIHRWLGLLIGVQLLAWSVGGFVFSILDIEDVRGERDVRPTASPPLPVREVAVSPREAVEALSHHADHAPPVHQVVLRHRRGRVAYELYDREKHPLALVDAATGEVTRRISKEEAANAALADFAHEANVASVSLLDGEPPNEYRGGRMPVYRVILDHPRRPHIYVCPVTGEILKRRNRLWRTFDFFWMLHIMDYDRRENFNHGLLTGASTLAIITSLTGLLLWGWRIPKRFRRSTSGVDRT